LDRRALIGGALQVAGISEHALTQVIAAENWYPVIAAVALLLVIVFNPDGIASDLARQGRQVAGRFRRRQGDVAPSPGPRGAPRQATQVMPKRLEVAGVTVRFGNVVALDRVDLTVEPGEVVGLIGPNGAGKTTLIEAATGFSCALPGACCSTDAPSSARRRGDGRPSE
jgi:ABC-type multidrug transport system fused ATPase/permease subunit